MVNTDKRAEEHSADVNAVDEDGETALMYAAQSGHFDIVKYLIEDHGADVNAVDEDGKTALMCAADGDHSDIAEYLRQKMKKS